MLAKYNVREIDPPLKQTNTPHQLTRPYINHAKAVDPLSPQPPTVEAAPCFLLGDTGLFRSHHTPTPSG
ncbi:MAG: hypothetical protein GOVbin52_32 [Prokaryotic dsDNA virus sp.]|nr:MAG: hypothetical protein GOVbin52_32 [Prokaryotic dsDNA virus sp.]